MKAVEEYIKNYTRNCCNEFSKTISVGLGGYISRKGFAPWLTPDHARKVAEIAREETIKEVCEWIEKNVYSYTWCEFQQHERGVEKDKLIEDLKKYLK
jgi:anaerobic selenocysteine-containing dehydrogenase